uniref:Uncharacterized protein n=1 Tax=Glossina austeni TaxID=7395 RepID=A0A1A9VVB1_GLOAU
MKQLRKESEAILIFGLFNAYLEYLYLMSIVYEQNNRFSLYATLHTTAIHHTLECTCDMPQAFVLAKQMDVISRNFSKAFDRYKMNSFVMLANNGFSRPNSLLKKL